MRLALKIVLLSILLYDPCVGKLSRFSVLKVT